ncbi:MAG TPA: hypothetical protein VGR45_08475, partial [Stellaceae bacterium]|nr:hypothetical protein [Stellaceae bacterium]
LSFLKDASGASARATWDSLRSRYPREVSRILRHLVGVDNGGLPNVNAALSRADKILRNPGPHLYWWNVGAVGVFYMREGTHTIVVHAAETVSQSPYYSQHDLRQAEGRL